MAKAMLTKREAQTLALICLGFDSTGAAYLMGVSKRTVDYHIANIFAKTPACKTLRLQAPENRFDLAHAWGYWGKPLDELRRIGAGMHKNEAREESKGTDTATEPGDSNVRNNRMVRGCTLCAD